MNTNKPCAKQIILPFLNWAGGKRWLVQRYNNLFPTDYKTYIEPFLGSGAVFFSIQPKKSILSDTNSDLVNTYCTIKNDYKRVFKLLKFHHKNHSKHYYYNIRKAKLRSKYSKAARFIYLNRTCWNGLYRVNLKGEFNVPIGTKKNAILGTDNFYVIAKLLNNSKIISTDFQKVIDEAEKNDFLFVDPPYTVKHKNNGFLKYNEILFKWEDQIRLHHSLLRANKRKVKIFLTNACHESIIDLYKNNFDINIVHRKSIISGKTCFRKDCEELIIKNFN